MRQTEHPKPPIWKDTVQESQVVLMKAKAGEVQEEGQLSTPIDAWLEITLQTYPGETKEAEGPAVPAGDRM